MAEESPDLRPSIDSVREEAGNENFNRIRLPSALREQILSGIDDSSVSLPLSSQDASVDGDHEKEGPGMTAPPQTPAAAAAVEAPTQKRRTSKFFGLGGSKDAQGKTSLSQVTASDELATPRAEPIDPLAQRGAQLRAEDKEDQLSPMASSGNLSKVSTQRDDEGNGHGAAEGAGGSAKRPGTIRRLTSRIKRTISTQG